MPNPLVSLAATAAGIGAGVFGKKLIESGWGAVFGEDAPTNQVTKTSAKDTKARRKQAKKDGLSKEEIAEIRDPQEDLPVWKLMLWTTLSGAVLQGLRLAARRAAAQGTERLTQRRPRPNRG